MKKLKSRGQRALKFFHLFFACMWVGAAIVLSVKQFFVSPSGGEELYGIQSTMKFIDDFIIIPGAVGALLTGVVYSGWTAWGWFIRPYVRPLGGKEEENSSPIRIHLSRSGSSSMPGGATITQPDMAFPVTSKGLVFSSERHVPQASGPQRTIRWSFQMPKAMLPRFR